MDTVRKGPPAGYNRFMSTPNYPEYRDELRALSADLSKTIPDVYSGFRRMHGAAMSEGTISAKHKELIALGIAIAVQCEGCIAAHVKQALGHGATAEEIAECIGVAINMGGGPATVYGALAWKAYQQFSGTPPPPETAG
jgi:AhpD family alkylhydroperoxidase